MGGVDGHFAAKQRPSAKLPPPQYGACRTSIQGSVGIRISGNRQLKKGHSQNPTCPFQTSKPCLSQIGALFGEVM